MALFELISNTRGRAASPNRPGLFVYRYLSSQTISHEDESVSGHSEAGISELQRAYKSLYTDAKLKHNGCKRKVATYHSFNAYFQRLIRMRWVEFIREEPSTSHQLSGGQWQNCPPPEHPMKRIYKLSQLGASLPLGYWAYPQHYYQDFIRNIIPPLLVRPVAPPRLAPPVIVPSPIPVKRPPKKERRPPRIKLVPEIVPEIKEEVAPPEFTTLEEIASYKSTLLTEINRIEQEWRTNPVPRTAISAVEELKRYFATLMQSINKAIPEVRDERYVLALRTLGMQTGNLDALVSKTPTGDETGEIIEYEKVQYNLKRRVPYSNEIIRLLNLVKDCCR